MLHYLAGATIQIANLVNYNCHPQVDGNKNEFVPKSHELVQLYFEMSSDKKKLSL